MDSDIPVPIRSVQKSNEESSLDASRIIRIFTNERSRVSEYCMAQIKSAIENSRRAHSLDEIRIQEIHLHENPELFEKERIFAVPTTIIGNRSLIGIPEEQALVKLIDEGY